MRVVRVMCSGRVSPELVLRTFRQGADGVIVLGCHIGDCHYAEGNHRTAKRMPMLRNLLSYAGIHPDRLRLDWASAAEGARLAEIVTEFTERIQELGKLETK
jgi:F420-non-reducing hydrogenase iron-sulfur subunit